LHENSEVIGDVPLAAITNLTLKELVTKMSLAKLSAKTIDSYSGPFKQVVASAVDDKNWQPAISDCMEPRICGHAYHRKTAPASWAEDEMARVVAAPGSRQMLFVLVKHSVLK
jgi:hypothetical protein